MLGTMTLPLFAGKVMNSGINMDRVVPPHRGLAAEGVTLLRWIPLNHGWLAPTSHKRVSVGRLRAVRIGRWRAWLHHQEMIQRSLMPSRLTLVPLGDEHLECEVTLDKNSDVMSYLDGGSEHASAHH